MKGDPGYPLPSGELGDDDLVCQLVYLPDRPEYWQALLGALSYMSTWRAWERDAEKRGKDAANNWRDAFELTIGCWRMTCLEQLQDDVAAILRIMEMGQSCCEDPDVTDGDQYTDRVEDGVGDVPQPIIDAGYADDAADWDGFADYKCMIAHVAVNQLDARLLEMAPIVNSYGAVFGGMASLAAILAVVFGTGGLALIFGLAAGVGAVALLYESLLEGDLLEILAAKVVTNHDDLVCAIYFADGDEGALVALNDKIDELFTTIEAVILKNMNLGPTLKALYSGRYDQQDIADTLLDAGYELDDFDCAMCDQVGEFFHYTDFETDTLEDWQEIDMSTPDVYGIEDHCARGFPIVTARLWINTGQLRDWAELPRTIGKKSQIHSLSFWYRFHSEDGLEFRVRLFHDGGTYLEDFDHTQTWTYVKIDFSPPLESTHSLDKVVIFAGTLQPQGSILVDQISVDYDSEL